MIITIYMSIGYWLDSKKFEIILTFKNKKIQQLKWTKPEIEIKAFWLYKTIQNTKYLYCFCQIILQYIITKDQHIPNDQNMERIWEIFFNLSKCVVKHWFKQNYSYVSHSLFAFSSPLHWCWIKNCFKPGERAGLGEWK